jgi:hypothetical protein
MTRWLDDGSLSEHNVCRSDQGFRAGGRRRARLSLNRDLFEGKMRNVCSFARVLDRDSTDVAFPIEVEQRVLVGVPGLGHFRRFELDVERVGILEVANFHG